MWIDGVMNNYFKFVLFNNEYKINVDLYNVRLDGLSYNKRLSERV